MNSILAKSSDSASGHRSHGTFDRIFFCVAFFATIIDVISCYPRQELCIPENCPEETDYVYYTCCNNQCCQQWQMWVVPALFASTAFTLGAFFALCFQCR
uniref:Transmembrane protein 213 n=1 Tax=Elaeophora elaphi TaxID=1147741 RepID=A0A0R3S5Y0_9BILA